MGEAGMGREHFEPRFVSGAWNGWQARREPQWRQRRAAVVELGKVARRPPKLRGRAGCAEPRLR